MRLKIHCPRCLESDLEDRHLEAHCPECNLNVVLIPGGYDALRDNIESHILDHQKISPRKIALAVDEDDHMLIQCSCNYHKYVAYILP